MIFGSERLDLRLEKPNLGAKRPSLWSYGSDLGFESADLRSIRPDLGSNRHDFGVERPNSKAMSV